MDPNAYPAIVTVLVIVIAVLIAYLVIQPRENQWLDAYLDEANRHLQTLDALDALDASHRALQADYLARGRELAAAEARARAAERELLP